MEVIVSVSMLVIITLMLCTAKRVTISFLRNIVKLYYTYGHS